MKYSRYSAVIGCSSSFCVENRRFLRVREVGISADLIRGRSSNFYGVWRGGRGATVAMATWRNIHVIDKAQRPGRTFLAPLLDDRWLNGVVGERSCEFSIRPLRLIRFFFLSLSFSLVQPSFPPSKNFFFGISGERGGRGGGEGGEDAAYTRI